jgi:hypothetical protein
MLSGTLARDHASGAVHEAAAMTLGWLGANVGGVALFVAPGFALTELFAPLRRLGWVQRLGYAHLLGVFAVAGSLFAASHLSGIPLRRPAIAVATLAPCALGLAAWMIRRARHTRRSTAQRSLPARLPPRRIAAWRLVWRLVLTVMALGPLAQALSAPAVDWDGRMIWSAQAAYLRDEGTVDAAVLRDARWFVVHPRYPLLMPVAQVAVQESFGAGEDDEFFHGLYFGFYAALLAVIYDGARRAAGPLAATLATLCAASLTYLGFGAGGATSSFSDVPLAGYFGASLVLLLEERTTVPGGLAAGCLLAGAVLTKNEGELLAIAALLLASWRLLRHRRHPAALIRLKWFLAAGLPVIAVALLLASWRAGIPNRQDEDYFRYFSLPALVRGAFARLPQIASELAHLTFLWFTWHGFWVVFLVVLAGGHLALRRRIPRLMLVAGVVPLAIGLAAYAVNEHFFRLMYETWDRFLLQGLAPLMILFAGALAHSLRGLRAPAASLPLENDGP